MKFYQFMSYSKRNNFQALLCLQRIKHNLYWKMKFLEQATYIRYDIAKLSKYVQISMLASSDYFLHRILWKLKGPGTSLQAIFFKEFFDENFIL